VKSSHRAVAVCNDCHTPHNLAGNYPGAVNNGFWHSFYFTTQRFQEPIRINARNLAIAEIACRDYHPALLETPGRRNQLVGGSPCTGCHAMAGHNLHR
jgi:cytochrome c nitrite reductase small subunit